MSQKTYSTTAGAIFLLIAIAHILRVALSVAWTMGTQTVPMWVSWAAIVVAGYMAYVGLRLGRKAASGS